MKKHLFAGLMVLITTGNMMHAKAKEERVLLKSPDGSIELKVEIKELLQYSLNVDGKTVMENCRISMEVEEQAILGFQPKLKDKKIKQKDQLIFPVVKQKTKEIVNRFNELELIFKNDYSVVFRVYDNGMAYRFQTRFGKEIKVIAETNEYNFAGESQVYFPEEKSFFSHNERTYLYENLDSISDERFCSLPALVEPENGPKILITETNLLDYPGMWLKGSSHKGLQAIFPHYALKSELKEDSDRNEPVSEYADYLALTQGTRDFPWRICMVAREDRDLITNQLTYQLADELQLEDASWIKPGKVAWDWWNANNIYGVDFEAGINTETYKYYIDFASKYGIEYIILDEGWYKLGDLLDVVPEINIEELVAYGEKKNVGIILWVIWKTLDDQLEESMDQFEKWGIKGLKVDFMQRDDQWMVNYYHRIAKACAQRKMLVDFHGSYKPAGIRRMYPNILTREGIKGMEHCKWSDHITPEHNVTIPFIRMVAGPMDYTPGAMVNAQKENFKDIWNRPMSMGTRCHQLAMYVIYESPLQMLADNPSNYLKEHECTEYIASVPTVWDDTKVLHAKVGDYIGLARKSGDEWFIGVMSDEEAREFEIDFSFLSEGEYSIEFFEDGTNAHRYASDYKKQVQKVSSVSKMKIKLAPGGGWAAKLVKE